MRNVLLAATAACALVASSSAWAAAPCVQAPVSVYTASGFSCSVGPVTFSSITLSTTTQGTGSITLTDFEPFKLVGPTGQVEYGLSLTYEADSGFGGGRADVQWSYDVTGNKLDDAYASLTGGTSGPSAIIALDETLSNGKTLNIVGDGIDAISFAPVGFLSVVKDQTNIAIPESIAFSSDIQNAFSVTGIPEPGTWVMMGLGFGFMGVLGFKRKQARFAF